ncbi:MAG: hypothetical protein ORN57_04300, partial [Alphaproteobacteria bacterium]|nr:hypothetical protein [Alphaproteobacteria bacterium]
MIHKNPQPMTAPGNGHDIVDGASRDQLLDKQLVFYQWRHGYRTAVDGLLVGAMVDSHARAVLDAGAGAGAVSLAAAYWQYQARQAQKNSGQRDGDDQVVAGVIHAVERNGDYFRLLEKNLWQENGWLGGKERFKLYHQPLHDFANGQQKKYHHQQPAPVDKGRDGVGTIAFDHILFNPPFDRATTSTAPPDDLKKQAM